MNPFIVTTITRGIPLPAEEPRLTGQCRAYASNGAWRFRILSRYTKAAELEPGRRLQLLRLDMGWVLRPAEEPDRLGCVTVDFEQKIQLHTDALGLDPTVKLEIMSIKLGLVLRPVGIPMPSVPSFDTDAFAAFGWRPVIVSILNDRPHIRFIDIQGKYLAATGLVPGDKVGVTVFEDKVAVLKHAGGTLLCMNKSAYPGFRLSERYFEQFGEVSHLIAIFGIGGVILVASQESLVQFGLDERHEFPGSRGLSRA
jgi:hypothetical protein